MAHSSIANFVPQIWTARFLQALNNASVFSALVNRNYEGEISAAGDTVKIPTMTSSVTVRDYVVRTDINDADNVSGDTQQFTINQQKYFHLYVDDVDAAQSRPALLDEAMRIAGQGVADTLDAYLQGLFQAKFDTDETVTDATDGSAVMDGHIAAIIELKRKMTEAKLPESGRWMVVPPLFISRLETYLLDKGNGTVFVPASTEQALRSGFSGRLLGFDLYVTNKLPKTGTGDAEKYNCIVGVGTEAVTLAQQITEIEPYRPEKRFGDAVKGLYVYGGYALTFPDPANRIWRLTIDVA